MIAPNFGNEMWGFFVQFFLMNKRKRLKYMWEEGMI